jgi:hypothetical protein
MKTRIICLLLILLSLTACGVNVSIKIDTTKVASAAAEIADFDLPSGYKPEFSAALDGYAMVSYTPGDGHSHLYLIQSEKETDGEKLARALENIAPGAYDPKTRMTIVETRLITLREQEVTLVISEGVTSEGETYLQAAAAFQGKGGPALLVLSAPNTSWDQEAVDAFFASVR